jgi:predicted P-loop ATPase
VKNPEAVFAEIEATQHSLAVIATERKSVGLVVPAGANYASSAGKLAASYNNAWLLLALEPWCFAYDELAQAHVLRGELPWPDHYSRELNDDTLRVIRNYLLDVWDVEFSKDDVREACLSLARAEPFNPVVEYLDLLEWDGVKRIDRWLPSYMGSPDNEYTRAVGRLFLVGAVARARRPGVKFDTALILEGSQGSGKSSALKVLGGAWFSESELGNVRDKDAAIALRNVWIQELPELTAMTRSDVNDLKAFVSRSEDRYRAPYARTPITEPRRCVFGGTTNEMAYLVDATGDRRYWPVMTGTIGLVQLACDRDQLWAEAGAVEAAGASLVLPSELWSLAAGEQAARRIADPWHDEVSTWLANESVPRIHSRDLLTNCLGLDPAVQTSAHGKRLRGVMQAIGGWTFRPQLRIGTVAGVGGYERTEA